VRIDSGDLRSRQRCAARRLGATGTRITVTSDLDEFAIAALAASPSTPTASAPRWSPDRARRRREWSTSSSLARMPVLGRGREASTDKASTGGRKAAFRTLDRGTATSELIAVSDGFERVDTGEEHPDARPCR
jgi:nicotinate phosphoribosyltransferase